MMLYPEKLRARFWSAALWAGIAAAAAVPRLVVLRHAETHLDADESIVGLMALHASQGGGLPAFFWGQHYGGGHVIEAALAAILFKLGGGPSAFLLQIVPALFACGMVALAFAWVREIYGTRTAVWAALAVSFSTPFLKSSLKADGYIETMFLCMLGFYLLHRVRGAVDARRGAAAFSYSAALGAVFGLAWWSYDFSLVLAAAAGIVLLRRKLIRGVAHTFVLCLGFLLGAAPVIWDNLAHDYANLRHLVSGTESGRPFYEHFWFAAMRLVTVQFPSFLTRECVHVFVYPPPWEAWLHAGLLLIGILVVVRQRARSRAPGVWALAPALFALVYCATGISGALDPRDPWNFTKNVWTLGRAPRYLLPLEPYLTLLAVIGIAILLKSKRPPARYLGVMSAACLAFVCALGFASILSDNTIYEGNIKTRPGSIPGVVERLKQEKITCVHTTYFIKWRILFESRETVHAMDIDIMRGGKQSYDFYEQNACGGDSPPTFVMHRSSPLGLEIYNNIRHGMIPYREPEAVGDHVIFLPEKHDDMEAQFHEQKKEREAVNRILIEKRAEDLSERTGMDPEMAEEVEMRMMEAMQEKLEALNAPDAVRREQERILREMDLKFSGKSATATLQTPAPAEDDILP